MIALLMLVGCLAAILLVGVFYSRFLARAWGEDASRKTPAEALNDGRDYVPTPTPIVTSAPEIDATTTSAMILRASEKKLLLPLLRRACRCRRI